MHEESVEKRLEVGHFGKPQIKQDEMKKFLGSFRERIYLTMTIAQMKEEYYQKALTHRIEQGFQTEATLHIHANISESLQTIFIHIAKTNDIPVTFYNNNSELTDDMIALSICSDTAIDVENIDIAEIYPNAKEEFTTVEPQKESLPFWKKWLG